MKHASVFPAQTSDSPQVQGLQGVQLEEGRALMVRTSSGEVSLRISMEQQELVVECLSGNLRFRSAQGVQLEAPRIELSAADTLQLRSGGDLHVEVGGQLTMQAKSMEMEATEGDARLTANDDVRISGERIRMNA